MANHNGKSKNKGGKKYAKAQQEKLSAGDFLAGFGKGEIFSFCVGLLLMLVALFSLAAMVSYLVTGESDFSLLESGSDWLNAKGQYKNVCGSWGAMIAYWLMNDLFGLASFLIPPYMIIVGLRLMKAFRFTLIRKFILLTLLMLWASVALGAVGELMPWTQDSFIRLGGNHGTLVARWLMQVVGTPGLMLLMAVTAVLYLIYLSAKTIEIIRNAFRFRFLKKERLERWKEMMKLRRKNEDDEDDDENGQEDDDEEEDKQNGQEGNEKVEVEFPVDDMGTIAGTDIDDGNNQPKVNQPGKTEPKQTKLDFGDDTKGADDPGLTIEQGETEKGSGKIERGDINTPYDPKLDLEHYKYPTLNLLKKAEDQGPQIDMIEQNANKNRIIEVLKQFGVEIKSIKATIGPTITLYEIVPSEGTRISRIRNLEDDIALSLAAEGIRIIAPIPGKGTIGIEVPNKKKCIVSMESVINSRVYQESKMELPCAIGKTISNEVFMFDLAKAPHLLVAGATGQGKSVGLNAIVTSLLYKKHPSELKIVMVDPKKVEFSIYSPIENHFLARLEEEEECIITDVQKVVKTLNSLCALMDTRYDLLKRAHARTIKEYNEMFKNRRLNPEHGHEFMPYIVVIVDEFGDLIMTAGKEVELPICRIAQLARAVGIHMIIATQRPQASIISGAIKANFPTRIAFKVSSMMDSRVILDRPGANQLIGKGDMLYLGSAEPVRVQCAFVDTPEVNDICHYISIQQSFLHPMYLPEVADQEGDGAGSAGPMDKKQLDPMFGDVAKFVVTNQSGSTSMIQRNYSIGYNRAGKIMDQLERMGVVGPQVGAKPREVLIKDPMTLESLLNNL
ncbi:MAG: DNA translocase FtsK 4TM domain-containing protein [Bacteroidaceae bacterium]|nr:DNA translocase FtsK 4TM domain-containing protein [Bacteroidaceae bacterium]